MLLSLLGAAAGLLIANGALSLFRWIGEASITRAAEIAIDMRVVLFTLAVSILTGVGFSLAPLLHVVKRNLQNAMKSGSTSITHAGGAQYFRQALVVSQLALALVLLTGTGLMLRAFWKLQEVDAGFNSNSVTTMSIGLSVGADYSSQDLWASLEARIATLPGIEAVADRQRRQARDEANRSTPAVDQGAIDG